MVNILSVDWEYFMELYPAFTSHFVTAYPYDDEKINAEGRAMLMNKHYALNDVFHMDNKEFRDYWGYKTPKIIDSVVLESEIAALYKLIEKYKKPCTKFSVHKSHEEIADVINRNYKDEEVYVFNIDICNDCDTPSGDEIDFSSWGYVLREENKIHQLNWVSRKIGEDPKDEDLEDEDPEVEDLKNAGIEHRYKGISDLDENPRAFSNGIDYIFLSHSEINTFPHLDDEFIKTAHNIAELVGIKEPSGLSNITSRWTKKVQDEINFLVEQMRIIREKWEAAGNGNDSQDLHKKFLQFFEDYCAECGIEINGYSQKLNNQVSNTNGPEFAISLSDTEVRKLRDYIDKYDIFPFRNSFHRTIPNVEEGLHLRVCLEQLGNELALSGDINVMERVEGVKFSSLKEMLTTKFDKPYDYMASGLYTLSSHVAEDDVKVLAPKILNLFLEAIRSDDPVAILDKSVWKYENGAPII